MIPSTTKLSLKESIEMVRSFMEMNDLPIPETGLLTRRSRDAMLREEYDELLKSRTRAEQLGGMCNLLYAVSGTLLTEGVADSIPNFTATQEFTPDFPIYMGANQVTEIGHFFKVVDQLDPDVARVTIARMLRSLASLILGQGTAAFWDFHGAFQEVHRHNMNKLWTEAETATMPKTHVKIKKPNGFVVKDDHNKVIKPPSWTPPSLARYLDMPEEAAEPLISGAKIKPIPENFLKK